MYSKASITFRQNGHGGTVAHGRQPGVHTYNSFTLQRVSGRFNSGGFNRLLMLNLDFIISSVIFVVGQPQHVETISGRSQYRLAQKVGGLEATILCYVVE